MTKIAVFNDPFGCMGVSAEDEYAEYKEQCEVIFKQPSVYHLESIVDFKPNTDVMLFDFGGMSLGNDLMDSNSREVIRMAEDNPSLLVLVTSSFTYRQAVEIELQNLELDLPNIWYCEDLCMLLTKDHDWKHLIDTSESAGEKDEKITEIITKYLGIKHENLKENGFIS